jgi:hypothetical protein
MRPLLFLTLALGLGGCDAFTDEAEGLMGRLDGTWTRTIVVERIAQDGTVTPQGEPSVTGYEIGRVVQCASRTFEHTAESDRIAASFPLTSPTQGRSCSVLTADSDALRVILIGEGNLSTDVAGTIREDSGSRHVWVFYAPRSDGTTLRSTWTLTRS